MDNNNIDAKNYSRSNTFAQVILRFVTSAVILAIKVQINKRGEKIVGR